MSDLVKRLMSDHPGDDMREVYFSDEAPNFNIDPFNGDTSCGKCGGCGAWLTVVRPGKAQCDFCEGDYDAATRWAAAARIEELEASIKWVDEVYPSRIEAGGAGIEITWAEFNAMQRALGVKVDARIGDQEGRAGHNHKLRVRANAAEARASVEQKRREAAEAKLATARNALEDIARQKRTDELETEYDVEVADFEGGYDAIIDVARAAIRALKSTNQT